jgi:hypothetical protein
MGRDDAEELLVKLIPRSKVGQFLFFMVENGFCAFVIVANTRAFTQGNYFWTVVTDAWFALQASLVGKLMVEDKDTRSWASIAGNMVGASIGACLSIWVTKRLYK